MYVLLIIILSLRFVLLIIFKSLNLDVLVGEIVGCDAIDEVVSNVGLSVVVVLVSDVLFDVALYNAVS